MKFLFHLGHPAHFHLFKNIIASLKSNGHTCFILIKKKDILEELLMKSGLEYINVLPHGRSDSKLGIALGMIKTDVSMLYYTRLFKPDLLIGTSFAISHIGKITGIASVNVNEDDADVVPFYSKFSYPWASCIVAPNVCRVGKWENKKIPYDGYHELAYLHPKHFLADKSIVCKYFDSEKPYFILRFALLNAHHDKGIRGINNEITYNIIKKLSPYGNVYITSEKKLVPEFEKYRMAINPLDIHHVMAFSKIFIGDSQTMAAEAGVLGIPFIRFNDFVGRISYLNELENRYNLGFGITPNNEALLYDTIDNLVNIPNLKENWKERRLKMLSEKIDLASFLTWFLEQFPKSIEILNNYPDFQRKFIFYGKELLVACTLFFSDL